MKTVAVIAEYNPFHNGHKYQLDTIRQKYNADKIIIIMSGDFCQRGIPAVFDKYSRTKMALENGADLIIELPVYFALGSAEYFAQGAVSLIDKLGVVNEINFGSEEADISKIYECAEILSNESEAYKQALNEALKSGKSFPEARNIVVRNQFSSQNINCKDIDFILSNSNNILGVEYIKAYIQRKNMNIVNSDISFTNITRLGAEYNSTTLKKNTFASANAIREGLKNDSSSISTLKEYVPSSVYDYMLSSEASFSFVDDYSEIVKYKLLSEFKNLLFNIKSDYTSEYYDLTQNLINTFANNIYKYSTLSEFILLCKSKNITHSRISRCLFHILLDMKQNTINELKKNDYCQYAKILGFNENGKEILKELKKHSKIPIITKLPKALKELDGIARESLVADIYASTIYQSTKVDDRPFANEFTREIIII